VSAPITIICTIPFVELSDEADLRRTTVSWGDATLLSSHAEGPRAATGDRSFRGQTNDDTELWSQPAASPRTNRIRRTSIRLDPGDDDTDATLGAALLLDETGSSCCERAPEHFVWSPAAAALM
jgi:hypothetical protein